MRQVWSVINPLASVFVSLWPLVAVGLVAVSARAEMAELNPTMSDYASGNKPGSIQAAVNTMYNLEVRKIATKSEPIPTQKVEIESNQIPLLIHFKSQSSKLKVIQSHKGGAGETQKTMSEDEPDILIHEVKKPIFQQVKEIIVPYRKTVQEIRPVQEQMETIVAKSHALNSQSYQKDDGSSDPERSNSLMSGPNRNSLPYMKEVEKFISQEEESDKAPYLPVKKEGHMPEANMLNLNFEPESRKSKFLTMPGPVIAGPSFGPVPPAEQHPVGLTMGKISKPARRHLHSPQPNVTFQRRMLFSPGWNTRQRKVISKPQKRKWKILFLRRY